MAKNGEILFDFAENKEEVSCSGTGIMTETPFTSPYLAESSFSDIKNMLGSDLALTTGDIQDGGKLRDVILFD